MKFMYSVTSYLCELDMTTKFHLNHKYQRMSAYNKMNGTSHTSLDTAFPVLTQSGRTHKKGRVNGLHTGKVMLHP